MKTPIYGSTSFKPTKKWWQSTLVACLMTGALFTSPLNAGELILKNFSDVSKLSLNGDAKTLKTQDGVVLRLTPSARIKAGSAFSTVKVSTAKFSSYFKFKISEPGGVRSGGADGFVFVVQPISAHASSEGGGMGYENIQKSVGVEFDTWNNENRNKNDSDENHVGINIKGAFNGKTVPVSPAFEKGQIWHAWVDYDGSQMEVRVNTTGKRPSKPLLTRELDISKIIGGTPEAFIGFTSATGGAYANHDIISWEFRDEFKPIGVASNIDVWIADSKRDAGAEPNKVSRRFWLSPGIWPRNKKDGINKYQNVELGQDNYVYVRAKNRGTLTASNTTVEVYRSIPSLGNRWPKGWKLVGKANIDTIEPNAYQDIAIRWDKDEIPKPGHYCFYVRLLNDDDPMTSKERGDSLVNTRSNNNIAWRNFNVVDLLKNVTDEFEVTVHNTKDEDANIDLAFEEEDNLLDNEGAGLVVDLGELFERWDTAGAEGTNIKSMGGTKVKLLKTPAKLTGISMKPAESQNIKMRLEALNPMPGEGTVREYQFSTQEWVDGELVGGVDYALMTRAQDTDTDGDGIKDIDDEDDDNDSMPDVWEIEFGLNPLVPNEPIPESTPIQTAQMPQSINYTLDLASPVTEQFEFVVSNSEKAANVDLVFEEKNNLLEKGEVSVLIDLGPLFQRWQEAGAKGVNVKHIEESTQVQVLKMPAKFMGLPMNANESQT
ncbi:MAG: L-type lectin-domain containing protein, partial [Pseudomonadota bacterium]